MRRRLILALLLACAVSATAAEFGFHTPDLTCRVRDSKARVVRSVARRRQFMKLSGFPKGRPGFVVDHVYPLCAGGCDVPSNMTWEEAPEAKAKDRWESALCHGRTTVTWAEWRSAHQ